MGTYLCGKSRSSGAFTLDTDIRERSLETATDLSRSARALTIETTRFGPLRLAEDRIITVVGGLLGFPEYTRYAILNHDDGREGPFRWLQSVDNPALAFVIIDPWVFKPDYAIELPDDVCANLQLSEAQPPLIFAIVTIPLDPSLMTANLQGPLVINPITRRAEQAVLMNSPYTTRHPILEGLLRTGNSDYATSSAIDHPAI
jgi:flagellar assembly factor FliW